MHRRLWSLKWRVPTLAVPLLVCSRQLSFSHADKKEIEPLKPVESIKVLTPQNLPQVVGGGEDVFLLVLADWCTRCEGSKIIYSQVARALEQAGSSVLVAAVDGTSYVPPGFSDSQHKLFPRLKFFPANSPSSLTLSDAGEEDSNFYQEPSLAAENIIRFIHSRCKHKFDLPKALAVCQQMDQATNASLREHFLGLMNHEEETSLQFKIMSLGPCAQQLNEGFVAWQFCQYFTDRQPAYDNSMQEIQKCLQTDNNKQYWEYVTQLANSQIQVAEKAKKKAG